MEGALGERLKREYHLKLDENIVMAKLVYLSEGRKALKELWEQYMDIARRYSLPFLATTPTRRANLERIQKANCDASVIAENVHFLRKIQQSSGIEMYIGGLMGCKGDAYTGEGRLEREEARHFHSWQANAFRDEKVDFLYAGIMPVLSEAIGIAEAMSDTQLPYFISFTIQKDGKLIDGTNINDAIGIIDNSVIHKPLCYMANCVHPNIVYEALSQPFNRTEVVKNRFLGIQANTSPLSYRELDNSEDLKCSEPSEFAEYMIRLAMDKNLKILGGCCGTDNRHMEAVAKKLIDILDLT
jgi:Homocysteine/selenocysteine methylase (S-methylmethionine-dependent)